jgi:hypothetical protein
MQEKRERLLAYFVLGEIRLVNAISPAQAINKVVTPLSFTWSISMPACPSKKCAISTLAYCVAIMSGEEFHIPVLKSKRC